MHRLTEDFWQELDFGTTWWRFRYLDDPLIAQAAALSAVESDILLFSAPADSRPTPRVSSWLNLWVPQRDQALGVMVPLFYPSTADALSNSPWMTELEEVAARTGIELLLSADLRESPLLSPANREMQHRSRQVGDVMDSILRRGRPGGDVPGHWGLNE